MPATASATAFRLLAACAVTLALTAAPAAAKDFCIDRASTAAVNPDFVIRSFRVPKAGKCKHVIGVGNPGFPAIILSGVACGSSDGTHVSFQLNAGSIPGPLGAQIPSSGAAFGVNVVLATDTLQGLAFIYSGDSTIGGSATGAECKVPQVP